jgi:hypothetical protein
MPWIAALEWIGTPHKTGIVLCGFCSALLLFKEKKEPLTEDMYNFLLRRAKEKLLRVSLLHSHVLFERDDMTVLITKWTCFCWSVLLLRTDFYWHMQGKHGVMNAYTLCCPLSMNRPFSALHFTLHVVRSSTRWFLNVFVVTAMT